MRHFAIIGSSGFVGSRICQYLSSFHCRISRVTFYEGRFYLYSNFTQKLLTCTQAEAFTHIIDCSNPGYLSLDDDQFLYSAQSFCSAIKPFVRNARYCLLSSISVYGFDQSYISSRIVPVPSNAYGQSKLFKELYFSSLLRSGYVKTLSIIRPTGVLGPSMGNTFVRRVISSACLNEPINIYSFDARFNSIVFVDDLIKLILMAFDSGSDQILFAGSYEPIPLLKLCEMVVRYYESASTILERKQGRPPYFLDLKNCDYSHFLRSTVNCMKISLPYIL